ncbi:MAG: ABC transporter permease [Chloroflexi bacterium]|nr:ABC transporter permease [Chloroflexota bacterium]
MSERPMDLVLPVATGPTEPSVPTEPSTPRRYRSARARVVADRRAWVGAACVVVVMVIAFGGPLVTTFDPGGFVGPPFQRASPEFVLGLDALGRDVFSQVLAGGALFLTEVVLATILGVGLGTLLGIALAAAPRRVSEAMLTVNDTILVMPQIVVALLVLTRLGATPVTLTLVIGFVHIPQTARVVMAATQRVIAQDYVAAALGLGVGRIGLVVHEILPNIAGVVSLEASIRLAISAVVLASLSYLGFAASGVEWGRMIHDNQGGLAIQPWAVMAPVIVLGVFLIGANLLRDAIARALASHT